VVYEEVVRHFGREILHPDGSVNRAKLAEIVFGPSNSGGTKPHRIEELNRIVHPAVIQRENEWMRDIGSKYPQAVAIVEAALLIEAGGADRYDYLIVVTCNEEQRIARFAARQKIDLEAARKEVARRMAAQFSEEEKIKAADFVIDNSGSLDQTQVQVHQLWEKLHSEASLIAGTTR
jgi:dephospho-CoA kinase